MFLEGGPCYWGFIPIVLRKQKEVLVKQPACGAERVTKKITYRNLRISSDISRKKKDSKKVTSKKNIRMGEAIIKR